MTRVVRDGNDNGRDHLTREIANYDTLVKRSIKGRRGRSAQTHIEVDGHTQDPTLEHDHDLGHLGLTSTEEGTGVMIVHTPPDNTRKNTNRLILQYHRDKALEDISDVPHLLHRAQILSKQLSAPSRLQQSLPYKPEDVVPIKQTQWASSLGFPQRIIHL